MHNITIRGSKGAVTLISDATFELSYEEVSVVKTMASGKLVKDFIGVRPVLEIPVGYLPLQNVQILKSIINSGEFLTVSYPSIDGDASGVFSVSQPTYKGVKYDQNGVELWVGMSITCKGQEVIRG